MIALFIDFASIAALFKTFFASAFGKAVLSAGLSLIASQLVASLSSPPVRERDQDGRRERQTALDGNVLSFGAAIPRVLGSQRVFPALLSDPLFYYDNGQEVVEAVYGLAGPHDLEAIRIDGAPADDMAGVEIMTRDGTRRQRPQNLLRRYAASEAPGIELQGHAVQTDGTTLDLSAGDVSLAVPQAQIYTKRAAADEFWLQLLLGQGLHREADSGDPVQVPLRVRVRPRGGAWVNMPEVHIRGRRLQPLRLTVRIIWQETAPVVAAAPGDGFAFAFASVPAQAGGSGGGWQADASFDSGSGDTRLDSNNVATTRLQRVQIDNFEARFYLDPAAFALGEYDVEVTRGAPIRSNLFSAGNYEYDGAVYDLFGWYDTPPRIRQSRSNIQDQITLARAVSVVNSTPTPDNRIAVIALRARGVAVRRLSVLAHGLVRAWDGSDWVAGQRSDNPADIFYSILTSNLWVDPFRRDEMDEAALLEWRARCVDEGYACNAMIEDASLDEVLRIVAGAGFARPRLVDTPATVVQDFDRSEEDPAHIFTPRNSADLTWTATRGDLPLGLRVLYRDADSEPQEVVVADKPGRVPGKLLEQVEYESVQTEAEARARALYDLRAGRHRRTFYSLQAPPSQLALLPGSLVGVVNDMISDRSIAGVLRDGFVEGAGQVVAVNTQVVGLGSDGWGDADTMADLGDMRRSGQRLEVYVQAEDGSWDKYDAVGFEGETRVIQLDDAPAGALRDGAEVAICAPGDMLRLRVLGISAQDDLSARVTLVDDASAEIWGSA